MTPVSWWIVTRLMKIYDGRDTDGDDVKIKKRVTLKANTLKDKYKDKFKDRYKDKYKDKNKEKDKYIDKQAL